MYESAKHKWTKNASDITVYQHYAISMYFAVVTMTTTGYGDISGHDSFVSVSVSVSVCLSLSLSLSSFSSFRAFSQAILICMADASKLMSSYSLIRAH